MANFYCKNWSKFIANKRKSLSRISTVFLSFIFFSLFSNNKLAAEEARKAHKVNEIAPEAAREPAGLAEKAAPTEEGWPNSD